VRKVMSVSARPALVCVIQAVTNPAREATRVRPAVQCVGELRRFPDQAQPKKTG